MSKNTQQTQHFRILPSKQLKTVVDALHGCAILAIWLNALPIRYRLALTLVILVLWMLNTIRWKANPIFLIYNGNSGWAISSDGANYLNATILKSTVVTNAAIFLHYRTDDKSKRALVIGMDSLPQNEYRRLKVRLRLSGSGQAL